MVKQRQGVVIPGAARLAVAVLFFGSGLSSLVLESVFLRQLSWIVGSAVTATALALAAFMGGLALGAASLGERADRTKRPLRLYGLLEVGAAASGALLVLFLGSGREILFAPLRALGTGHLEKLVLFSLSLLCVGLPAALMGGTLPAIARFAIREPTAMLAPLAALYGINTLGGATGVLVAGFVLFERLGVSKTGYAAAALGAVVGAAAILLDLAYAGSSGTAAHSPEPRPGEVSAGLRAACLVAAGVGGVAALGLEVVWTRLLSLPLRSYAYSFSLMLSIFLVGIVIGALLLAALAPRVKDPAKALGRAQLALGVYVASSLLWIPMLLVPPEASGFGEFLARGALRAALVVLPPTILSGMALPLAARVSSSEPSRLSRTVGLLYAVNTAGGIVGALLAALVLIPAAGAHRALAVLSAIVAASGALVLAAGRRGLVARLSAAGLATACAMAAALPADPFVRSFLRSSIGREAIGEVLAYRESRDDTIAVVTKDYGFFDPGAKSLLTNGVSMSATARPVWRYMAAEGHLPVLFSRDASRALAIGLGTGITLGAIASHPEVQSIRAVELSAGVLKTLPLFDEENERAYLDPRVLIAHEDGRHLLELSNETFGLVTVEPPPPIVAGATNLYSLDFYRTCRRRLEPGGVMAQWLPLHAQSFFSARMTAKTFLEAFPHVQLWLPSVRDAVLIGSAEPLVLDLARVKRAYEEPKTRENLRRAYLETPEALLASCLLDREALARWAGDAPVLTDDRPLMEFFRASGANMRDRDIAGLLELPQGPWDFVRGLETEPGLRRAVELENRALRLYLRANVHEDTKAGTEAATVSRGTEFFLFRLGCARDQLAYLEKTTGRGPRWSSQISRCESLGR